MYREVEGKLYCERGSWFPSPINNAGLMVASYERDECLTPGSMKLPEWLWAIGWRASLEARCCGIMVAGAGGRKDTAEAYIWSTPCGYPQASRRDRFPHFIWLLTKYRPGDDPVTAVPPNMIGTEGRESHTSAEDCESRNPIAGERGTTYEPISSS